MVSDRFYKRMCMTGLQEARYQRELEHKREMAKDRRDWELYWDFYTGFREPYVDKVRKGPMTRLRDKGMITITEEFFPSLGINRFRIDVVPHNKLGGKIRLRQTPTPRALDL